MKRTLLLLILIIFLGTSAYSQVINFGKTLPVRAYSLTIAPLYHVGEFNLSSIKGLSYMVMGGYGFGYDVDVNVKYGNTYSLADGEVKNSPDYFGVDMQYLFRETRQSYYSLYGGVHKWEEYGIDLTFSYTHTPRYLVNLTAGLDLDVDFSNELALRAWIPLNIGFNFDDRYFIFFEYDLPATERSWDILGGGITFIFR